MGHSSEEICICTTSEGQTKLIIEMITKKCAWHEQFGKPANICNVENLQGASYDIVIFSTVLTDKLRNLENVKRMIPGINSSLRGLYVVGCLSLFKKHLDLSMEIKIFEQYPHQLVRENEEVVRSTEQLYEICQKILLEKEL